MKVTVSIKRPVAGHPLVRKFELDGKEYKYQRAELSRILTDTTSDSNSNSLGIFGTKGRLYRSEVPLDFDFGYDLDMVNYLDVTEYLSELKRRVDWVNAEFVKQYPLHESEGVLELATVNAVSHDEEQVEYH